jgi:hypothetical protein
MNYKQTHLQLTQQLYSDSTRSAWEQEQIKQRLHYIEVEYDYRPRYSESVLRPRCSNSKTKQSHKPKRSK